MTRRPAPHSEDELLDLHELLLEHGRAGDETRLPEHLRTRILARTARPRPRRRARHARARARDLVLRVAACAASLLGLSLVSPDTLAATTSSSAAVLETRPLDWSTVLPRTPAAEAWYTPLGDPVTGGPWLLGGVALLLGGAGAVLTLRGADR